MHFKLCNFLPHAVWISCQGLLSMDWVQDPSWPPFCFICFYAPNILFAPMPATMLQILIIVYLTDSHQVKSKDTPRSRRRLDETQRALRAVPSQSPAVMVKARHSFCVKITQVKLQWNALQRTCPLTHNPAANVGSLQSRPASLNLFF